MKLEKFKNLGIICNDNYVYAIYCNNCNNFKLCEIRLRNAGIVFEQISVYPLKESPNIYYNVNNIT